VGMAGGAHHLSDDWQLIISPWPALSRPTSVARLRGR
jgi:hypothetical protein